MHQCRFRNCSFLPRFDNALPAPSAAPPFPVREPWLALLLRQQRSGEPQEHRARHGPHPAPVGGDGSRLPLSGRLIASITQAGCRCPRSRLCGIRRGRIGDRPITSGMSRRRTSSTRSSASSWKASSRARAIGIEPLRASSSRNFAHSSVAASWRTASCESTVTTVATGAYHNAHTRALAENAAVE